MTTFMKEDCYYTHGSLVRKRSYDTDIGIDIDNKKKGYSLFSVLITVNIRILYCQCFISLSLDLIITIPQKIITSYNLI